MVDLRRAGLLEAVLRLADLAKTMEQDGNLARSRVARLDPPPLNWSILMVRIMKEDRYGEERIKDDWLDQAGMPRPPDRRRRAAPTAHSRIVLRLLPSLSHSLVPG